jgi:hypothetical protein
VRPASKLGAWFVVADASALAVHDRIEFDHELRRAGFERSIARAFRSSALIPLNH